jgi:hypothetical protein
VVDLAAPLIHRDLGLSEAGIAALAGLPLLPFGSGAVPGALLIARVGAPLGDDA